MTIGKRLREFAEAKFGSVKNLAFALNVTAPSIYGYLNDTQQLGTPTLLRLHDLGMSIEWLLLGKGTMFAQEEKTENSNQLTIHINITI